jgi:hypothetical protein
MACGGNATYVLDSHLDVRLRLRPSSEACGGPNRLSVYSSNGIVTALPVPTVMNSSLPGLWQYQGCLRLVTSAWLHPTFC